MRLSSPRARVGSVFCLALVWLLPGGREAGGSSPPPLWSARYEVRFGSSGSDIPQAEIRARLEWLGEPGRRPPAVALKMADDGFPGGYGAHVKGLSLDQEGTELPVPADGAVQFQYVVSLGHDASDWGPGPDEAPYRFAGGAFWTGRSLFITAEGSQIELSLAADPGSRISVSYPPVPGAPGRYRVADESRLQNSFLMVGKHREARLEVGDAEIVLALAGAMEDSMSVVEPAIRRFLDASEGLFRGAPPRRILVAGSVGAPKGSLHGGTFGDDVSILADEPLGDGNADRWRPFLCHEIFHLWNGNTLHFDGQAYWFSEGFTEYYSHELALRLGQISTDRFDATVREKAAAYLEAAGEKGLLAAGEEKFLSTALVYDGGFLAALSLDLRIRSATANRRSLDDVMAALYRQMIRSAGQSLTQEDVRREVSRAAGASLDDFFTRHIAGSEVLPLAEDFRRAGLELRAEISQLPEVEAVLGTLLRCPSARIVDAGLELLVCAPGDLAAGDILVEAGGVGVGGFQALRRGLKDAAPGSKASVVVLRGGQRRALDVALGGDPRQPLPTSRHAEVSLQEIPAAGKKAQRIRASVFGR